MNFLVCFLKFGQFYHLSIVFDPIIKFVIECPSRPGVLRALQKHRNKTT